MLVSIVVLKQLLGLTDIDHALPPLLHPCALLFPSPVIFQLRVEKSSLCWVEQQLESQGDVMELLSCIGGRASTGL